MLRVQWDDPVLRITLDRPEVRNAFNDELIARLTDAFATAPAATRVIVLAGEGKAFCAGGDLDWMRRASAYGEEENYQDALKLAGMFQTIAESSAYVIARVHGAAFGGGCGLIAASDVGIASHEALFALSEVRLGLCAGTISKHVIPKIGVGHARALFGSGEAFSAEHALRIGLIHEIGDVDALVAAKIKQVLSVGPLAVAETKRLIRDFPLTSEEAASRLAKIRAGEEAREGVAAFLERRKASFVVER